MPRPISNNKTPPNKTMGTSVKKQVGIQSPVISPQKDTVIDDTHMQDATTTVTATITPATLEKNLECNEVQLFDYDIKVGIEPIEEMAADSMKTAMKPKPPYAKMNLRKELE